MTMQEQHNPISRFTRKRHFILGTLFLIVLIVATIWILCFRGTATLRIAEGSIFGTVYHIKYESPKKLDTLILCELHQVDQSLSVFNENSTISLINKGKITKADGMLFEVIEKAQQISKKTNGAFDVTVMPLVNAWGFGFKNSTFPTKQQIDSLKHFIGYQKITLRSDSIIIKKDARIMIDCGAIAKGYAADRIARLLRENGVRNYMIEIGGEVITKGRNPDGNPWKIGISKPIPKSKDLQTILSLENAALATSGNYRNYYEVNGKKIAHTIDPRTGFPVQHTLLSATVFARDCATADAYATAFMVLGLNDAINIVKADQTLNAIFIYSDSKGNLQTVDLRNK